MPIAIMAFGSDGDNAIGLEIISRIDALSFPFQVAVISGGTEVLSTLERARGYDALVLVEAASMGECPGTIRTFDLNEMVLREPPKPILLHSMSMDRDLLFAHKFLDLPPTRLVCVEPESPGGTVLSETLLSRMDTYLEAVSKAVEQLRQ